MTEAVYYYAVAGSILLAITAWTAFEYYKHLRKAHKEYEKAKGSVEDIVLSFNREIKGEANRINKVERKVESIVTKVDSTTKKVEVIEEKILPLENSVKNIADSNMEILARLAAVETRLYEVGGVQEELKSKVTALNEQMQKATTMPEVISEPVMPIKRDKALATLTDTEIDVLELLAIEGPKTAPEIKERVKLSREHTARLMKKLYEEGYLERETGKIPFKYRLKEEMQKLLKKTEAEQT
ncbi:MAG: helix-turn-helix domain-containing protein [Candidatus Bathyarchaeia archaeon]